LRRAESAPAASLPVIPCRSACRVWSRLRQNTMETTMAIDYQHSLQRGFGTRQQTYTEQDTIL
jgi:hypothetical protein